MQSLWKGCLHQVTEPTLSSHHFGTPYVSTASMKPSAPNTRAGGGAPAMESRLSTLWVWGSNFTRGSQPAKLPSFADTALKTLPQASARWASPWALALGIRSPSLHESSRCSPEQLFSIAMKCSKQRAKQVGWRPNPGLFAIDVFSVPLYAIPFACSHCSYAIPFACSHCSVWAPS